MNLDQLEKQVYGAVRREFSPSPETSSRIRRAVLARILAAASLTAAGSTKAGLLAAALGKTAWVIGLVGAGFAAGWGAHVAVGSRSQAPSSSASTVPTGRPSWHPGAAISETPTDSSRPPRLGASAEAASDTERMAGRTVAPGGPVPIRSAASVAQEQLFEEVRLLREADRALRAGDPGTALTLLNQLERSVPHGKLDEERAAARRLAECLQVPGAPAREAATVFLSAHPSTVYSGRIRQVCGLGSDVSD